MNLQESPLEPRQDFITYEEATQAIQKIVDNLDPEDRWLVAVFKYQENHLNQRREVTCDRTTWNWPISEYGLAIQALKKLQRAELESDEPPPLEFFQGPLGGGDNGDD